MNTIFFIDSSSSKFDSHCGWPAFSSSLGTSVRRQKDVDGYREEILCANCDGHLGLFNISILQFYVLYKSM